MLHRNFIFIKFNKVGLCQVGLYINVMNKESFKFLITGRLITLKQPYLRIKKVEQFLIHLTLKLNTI